MAIHYQHQLDRTFHALGDGTRRKMLSLLAKRREVTASELGTPFQIAQPTVSKHIRVLEQAGLISRRIEGRVHRFQLQIKPLNEAQHWILKHKEFWEGSLDALGDLLDKMSTDQDL
ncbi:MAG: helix-turn-helix transcriptional regulator [Planctomycetaceae bacterium]|nr:helix-turn-helix transcriptional regulator [Planctomycetaceae bacterium]MCA9019117.1 helix-turn-helix transcriptional regulator [Planctomycetaceae bacterium]